MSAPVTCSRCRRLVEEARRVLEELASRHPDAAYARALLGRALEAMGR